MRCEPLFILLPRCQRLKLPLKFRMPQSPTRVLGESDSGTRTWRHIDFAAWSQRGVLLVKPLAELTMLDVVNAVDPIKRIKTCPLGLSSHGTRLCPLHAKLDRALADAERAFGGTSLAEILQEPSPSTPLCDFPSKVASEETQRQPKKQKAQAKRALARRRNDASTNIRTIALVACILFAIGCANGIKVRHPILQCANGLV